MAAMFFTPKLGLTLEGMLRLLEQSPPFAQTVLGLMVLLAGYYVLRLLFRLLRAALKVVLALGLIAVLVFALDMGHEQTAEQDLPKLEHRRFALPSFEFSPIDTLTRLAAGSNVFGLMSSTGGGSERQLKSREENGR